MNESRGLSHSDIARSTEQTIQAKLSSSLAAHQLVLTLAMVLAGVAFGGSLGYQFVYDDHAQIITNTFVHSWRFAPRYFTQHVWESIIPGAVSNYYRPMFLLWLRLNHMVFELQPWGWHLTSLLMHLGVTLSVYFLALRLTRERLTAAFAAMIFGLHPVHVEGIVWISGVTEPLLALFFITSFLCHLRSRGNNPQSKVWTGLSVFLFLGALFSKETAVTLPVFVFLYEWLFRSPQGTSSRRAQTNSQIQRIRNAAGAVLPYLGATPVYLVLRGVALQGLSHTLTPLPLTTLVFTAPSLLWFYIKRLVWPVRMTLTYTTPYVSAPHWDAFGLPLVAMGAVAFVVWAWGRRPLGPSGDGLPWCERKGRLIAFASAWILLPLLPPLNLTAFPMNDFVHDRYTYLPSVGFAIIAAMVLRSIRIGRTQVWGLSAIQLGIAAMVSALCVWGALEESIVWSNDLLLYYRGVTVSPNNTLMRTNLANALAENGHPDEAIAMFLDVLNHNAQIWEANYNLGLSYYQLGRVQEAERYFERAVALNPNKAASRLYLGLTELKLGHLDKAAAEIHQAVRINPDVYGVHFARGMVLKLQGDYAGAIEEFKEELSLNPDQNVAREQMAEAEQRLRGSRPGESAPSASSNLP